MNLIKKLLRHTLLPLSLGALLSGCTFLPSEESSSSSFENSSQYSSKSSSVSKPNSSSSSSVSSVKPGDYNYATTINVVASKSLEALSAGSVKVANSKSFLNGAELQVYANALPSDTTVSIAEVNNPPELPEGLGYVSALDLEPDGTHFNFPVRIKIPYKDAELNIAGTSDETDLKLYSYDKSSCSWSQADIISVDTLNKNITAEISHFSYYAITCLNGTPPDDLGTPQPGDLLYCLGCLFEKNGNGWRPGHVGIYMGEQPYPGTGLASEDVKRFGLYNVIEALKDGVQYSYCDIPNVKETYENYLASFGGSAVYMGARKLKGFSLTEQQRTIITNFAVNQIGKPYAWGQTAGVLFGMLKGSLVKGPNSFNCVGLGEKGYEVAGVNNGQGLVSSWDEEVGEQGMPPALTPAEQYNATEPAVRNFQSAETDTITIQPGSEGNDAYVKTDYVGGNYYYSGFGDADYLDVNNSFEDDETLIQFPVSIPSNANIISAELDLYGCGAYSEETSVIDAYEITSPWDESSVKWNTKPSYGKEISSLILDDEIKFFGWDITSAVKDWASGNPNYGIALTTSYSRPFGGTFNGSFYSGDNSDSEKRPKLIVTYSIPK